MVELRLITSEDLPELLRIYASTRDSEMELVAAWPSEHKQQFLSQQFLAQHQYYQEFYKGASFQMILEDGMPVGRLYVHWNYSSTEVRIMDIALLPEHRDKGIGSQLLKNILAKATEVKKNVTIHVEMNNPALQLYQRLGFKKIGEFNTVYHLYQWSTNNQNK